jgi:hypothetical protein
MIQSKSFFTQKVLLWAAMFVLLTNSLLPAATATFYPLMDACVRSDVPDWNFGFSANLYAGDYSGSTRRTYMTFDINPLPDNQRILSAQLRLKCDVVSSIVPEIGVYYSDDFIWYENSITWNNAPLLDYDQQPTYTVTAAVGDNFWYVTADVNSAYHDQGYYSLVIKRPQEEWATRWASFWSREASVSGDRPYLEVVYEQIKYGGGSGTAQDPYLIYTAAQMNSIGTNPGDWGKYFKLMANIDIGVYTGTQYNIIGTDMSNKFTGVFDGNNHTISNFVYAASGKNNVGLFGYVDSVGAEIKNVFLTDPNVRISNGSYGVGALIGTFYRGNVYNCRTQRGLVEGPDNVGGLIGWSWGGTISQCSSTTDAYGVDAVGGLIGGNTSTMSNCSSNTYVHGNNSVGVLIGDNQSQVEKCSSDGAAVGIQDRAGGFVGENSGSISYCCSTGTVNGRYEIGGFAGRNLGTLSNCFASGSAAGTNKVGGLVGLNWKTTGSGTISKCYSTGGVTGSYPCGGLVGDNADGIVEDSFWDMQTSGQASSAGGTGKTTLEMKTKSTFTNWDFEAVWRLCTDETAYPRFIRQFKQAGDFECPDTVNFEDLAYFTDYWLETNCQTSDNCNGTDFDFTGNVNLADFAVFADRWLEGI